ncbi:MAG: acyl-CoA hydrolase [Candidatus Azotimanducaceae bacterium]|jgi:acyl-CoA hydrolase
MKKSNEITFQFISEPGDVNFGGNVHGGTVMKWIDQAAYTCARAWSETYCVTVYVGGIRFYKPINIGEMIKVQATVIYTGNSSIHIGVDVFSKGISQAHYVKKTHCIIVFVSVDENGKPQKVFQWQPESEQEKGMEQYAIKLTDLRKQIEQEMQEFLE